MEVGINGHSTENDKGQDFTGADDPGHQNSSPLCGYILILPTPILLRSATIKGMLGNRGK